jgi:4-hydroxy-tetrahydrodipicolinate synthase
MLPNGCYVAIVTPFLEDGSIDEAGLRSNIKHVIAGGVSGIVPCGTTGEAVTMSNDENERVISIAVEEAKGKVKVIAGAGANDTVKAVKLAQRAKEIGVDAILTITPYYNKPTQSGLIAHFTKIAEEADVDMVLYNVPGRTGVNMLPSTVKELTKLKQVVAVKEASGDISQVSEINRICGDDIMIFSGDDALTLPMLSVGAKGVISVLGNILPEIMTNIVKEWFDGNADKARELHNAMVPLADSMFIESNPIPVKTAMTAMGLSAGVFRLPLVEMEAVNKDKLLSIFVKAGYLK